MRKPKLPHPALSPIKSAAASHAGYDPVKQELVVTFNNGNTYRYDRVPPNIGETVMGAQSFGTSFGRHVGGRYKGTKL